VNIGALEDLSHRRLASCLIDHIGDLGISVAAFRVGQEAEGGWEITAHDHVTGDWWNVKADRALDAAVELAMMVGIDLASRDGAGHARTSTWSAAQSA